jgi:hypothetical protein
MDATYSGANIFTVAGDRTLEFVPDRRVRADCAASGIKYLTVLSSVYSTDTVVTTKESELTPNLTDVLYGSIEPGELGSLPDHDHQGGEGSGGPIEVETTLSGLTDTPADYGNAGDFLQSTSSGTEWAHVSSTAVSSNLYAWELVESQTVTSGALSVTVSGIDGDIDDEWKIILKNTSLPAGPEEVRLRYNNDSGTNYYLAYMYPDDTVFVAGYSTRDNMFLLSGNRSAALSISELNLKNTGNRRVAMTNTAHHHGANFDYMGLIHYSHWGNTSDKITQFEVYSSGSAFTGTVEIYKKANVSVNVLTVSHNPAIKGKQSIKVEFATTSGVYVNPGSVEINDTLYTVNTQLTKEMPTLSGSTWYYVYAKEPTTGSVITLGDVEHTDVAPNKDLEKMGYYHPTNSTWRCVGFCYSDSSNIVEKYIVDGYDWKFSGTQQVLSNTVVSAPLLVAQRVPLGNLLVDVTTRARYENVTTTDVFVYTGSSTGYTRYIGNIRTTTTDLAHAIILECDSSKQIGISATPSYDIRCQMWTNGFKIPDLIYTGA